MPAAVFVLSTGRCGTQWLTKTLRMLFPDWQIVHEPLSFNYRPDLNTETSPLAYNEALILQHLSAVQQRLDQGQGYIETGFPCWRHIQWFKQQLSGKVKVIHIHRDPVDTVGSLLKINAFVPPYLPQLPLKNLFLPHPGHGYLAQWQPLWQQLNPAEKNLWYWSEVQASALQLRDAWPEDDWLELRFEQLFSTTTAQALSTLLGADTPSDIIAPGRVDHYGTDAIIPCAVTFPLLQHIPAISLLAKRFGYTIDFWRSS